MKNSEIKATLDAGCAVERLKVFGDSMMPLIASGQSLRIEPASTLNVVLKTGDIVFCKVRGSFLHS